MPLILPQVSGVNLNILLVKLSSLGDVLHNLPIVWDIRHHYPNAQIDWIVDEFFVDLVKPLQSTATFRGIDNIIPIPLRQCHKALKRGRLLQILHEFNAMRRQLKRHSYDVIIETQGLIKSAIVCRLARTNTAASIVGLANRMEHSGYEPIARWCYTQVVPVEKRGHAIDCYRKVAAGAFNKPSPHRKTNPPTFYPPHYIESLQAQPNPLGLEKGHYVLCFHATARAAKCWDLKAWRLIGQVLAKKGLTIVYPWGNPLEKKISETLALEQPAALVPKAFTMSEAFTLIAQARLTLGVDTGLTHLSAVLLKPTIELYIDSPRWKTEGYWHSNLINLGDKRLAPSHDEVEAMIDKLLA